MSDDLINIEVNGVPLKARKGQMIIHVTDEHSVYVPRFCYHEKLTIAANCRMCLVEVEKAPKPLPACATPIAEGMKIFTKSVKAIGAQKATMEFLLINHPLDCPICDQGGECELQDLAMGFGRDIARFNERKRVVKDKNLGPLVSTDMTRCIHCTRCVRFGQEVAGIQELGTTGRGENTEIGTFIEKSVDHELSGNIIDLCPVGALNSKPFRYRGRSWEMNQVPMVSPHDPIGTNLFGHVLRGRLMRVVPRPNEAINETWIADRDRFSYEGIYSDDRLATPMIRVEGELRPTDWETALEAAVQGLRESIGRHGAAQVGLLAAPTATVEELHLLTRLARSVGVANIDHRLRQHDFRDQEHDPIFPGLGLSVADVEKVSAALIVGSNLRHEAPILAHRLRKAATRHGARISFLNPAIFEFKFPVAQYLQVESAGLLNELGALLQAASAKTGQAAPTSLTALCDSATVTEQHRTIVEQLTSGERRLILLGALALRHAAYADLRAAAAALAALTGATLGYLPEGGNAVGAALMGALPHREAGGKAATVTGLNARQMLETSLKAYVLFGGVEPEADSLAPSAGQAVGRAEFVVALTPYAPESIRKVAHVLLPIGTFAETSGTFVNVEGRWQSFAGVARPVGEARPGWKVLRVIGTLLNIPGFEFASSEEVRDAAREAAGQATGGEGFTGTRAVAASAAGTVDVPMYQIDAVVRRAPALQQTRDGGLSAVIY